MNHISSVTPPPSLNPISDRTQKAPQKNTVEIFKKHHSQATEVRHLGAKHAKEQAESPVCSKTSELFEQAIVQKETLAPPESRRKFDGVVFQYAYALWHTPLLFESTARLPHKEASLAQFSSWLNHLLRSRGFRTTPAFITGGAVSQLGQLDPDASPQQARQWVQNLNDIDLTLQIPPEFAESFPQVRKIICEAIGCLPSVNGSVMEDWRDTTTYIHEDSWIREKLGGHQESWSITKLGPLDRFAPRPVHSTALPIKLDVKIIASTRRYHLTSADSFYLYLNNLADQTVTIGSYCHLGIERCLADLKSNTIFSDKPHEIKRGLFKYCDALTKGKQTQQPELTIIHLLKLQADLKTSYDVANRWRRYLNEHYPLESKGKRLCLLHHITFITFLAASTYRTEQSLILSEYCKTHSDASRFLSNKPPYSWEEELQKRFPVPYLQELSKALIELLATLPPLEGEIEKWLAACIAFPQESALLLALFFLKSTKEMDSSLYFEEVQGEYRLALAINPVVLLQIAMGRFSTPPSLEVRKTIGALLDLSDPVDPILALLRCVIEFLHKEKKESQLMECRAIALAYLPEQASYLFDTPQIFQSEETSLISWFGKLKKGDDQTALYQLTSLSLKEDVSPSNKKKRLHQQITGLLRAHDKDSLLLMTAHIAALAQIQQNPSIPERTLEAFQRLLPLLKDPHRYFTALFDLLYPDHTMPSAKGAEDFLFELFLDAPQSAMINQAIAACKQPPFPSLQNQLKALRKIAKLSLSNSYDWAFKRLSQLLDSTTPIEEVELYKIYGTLLNADHSLSESEWLTPFVSRRPSINAPLSSFLISTQLKRLLHGENLTMARQLLESPFATVQFDHSPKYLARVHRLFFNHLLEKKKLLEIQNSLHAVIFTKAPINQREQTLRSAAHAASMTLETFDLFFYFATAYQNNASAERQHLLLLEGVDPLLQKLPPNALFKTLDLIVASSFPLHRHPKFLGNLTAVLQKTILASKSRPSIAEEQKTSLSSFLAYGRHQSALPRHHLIALGEVAQTLLKQKSEGALKKELREWALFLAQIDPSKRVATLKELATDKSLDKESASRGLRLWSEHLLTTLQQENYNEFTLTLAKAPKSTLRALQTEKIVEPLIAWITKLYGSESSIAQGRALYQASIVHHLFDPACTRLRSALQRLSQRLALASDRSMLRLDWPLVSSYLIQHLLVDDPIDLQLLNFVCDQFTALAANRKKGLAESQIKELCQISERMKAGWNLQTTRYRQNSPQYICYQKMLSTLMGSADPKMKVCAFSLFHSIQQRMPPLPKKALSPLLEKMEGIKTPIKTLLYQNFCDVFLLFDSSGSLPSKAIIHHITNFKDYLREDQQTRVIPLIAKLFEIDLFAQITQKQQKAEAINTCLILLQKCADFMLSNMLDDSVKIQYWASVDNFTDKLLKVAKEAFSLPQDRSNMVSIWENRIEIALCKSDFDLIKTSCWRMFVEGNLQELWANSKSTLSWTYCNYVKRLLKLNPSAKTIQELWHFTSQTFLKTTIISEKKSTIYVIDQLLALSVENKMMTTAYEILKFSLVERFWDDLFPSDGYLFTNFFTEYSAVSSAAHLKIVWAHFFELHSYISNLDQDQFFNILITLLEQSLLLEDNLNVIDSRFSLMVPHKEMIARFPEPILQIVAKAYQKVEAAKHTSPALNIIFSIAYQNNNFERMRPPQQALLYQVASAYLKSQMRFTSLETLSAVIQELNHFSLRKMVQPNQAKEICMDYFQHIFEKPCKRNFHDAIDQISLWSHTFLKTYRQEIICIYQRLVHMAVQLDGQDQVEFTRKLNEYWRHTNYTNCDLLSAEELTACQLELMQAMILSRNKHFMPLLGEISSYYERIMLQEASFFPIPDMSEEAPRDQVPLHDVIKKVFSNGYSSMEQLIGKFINNLQ